MSLFKKSLPFFLPALVALYMLFGAMSYQSGRVHTENINEYIPWALHEHGHDLFHFKDYLQVFNMDRFEVREPRFTRPLANLLLILNHKIRSQLWQFIVPHPVLSPLLLIPLLIAPYFLFLFLRGRGLSLSWALGLCAFYMATPGSLYPFYLNFRHGKMMVNCCFFVMWYLADRLQKTKNGKRFFILFWPISMSAWFWDETAFLVWLSTGLLLFEWWENRSAYLFFFLLQPLLYFLCIQVLFPALAGHLGFMSREFIFYPPLLEAKEKIHLFFQYFPLNFKLLMTDTVGLHSPALPPSFFGKFILGLNLVVVSSMFLLLLKKIKKSGKILGKWLLIFVGLASLHTVLMISVHIYSSGQFYLGAYIGPFFVFFLLECLQKLKPPTWVLMLFFCSSILGMIYKTHYLNLNLKYQYKVFAMKDGYHALDEDRINRYRLNPPLNSFLREQTENIWKNYRATGRMEKYFYSSEFFEYRYVFLETLP